jgi:dehydrogenase/reductase SDR family member 12
MDVSALIDDALEISIVGSFSRFGYDTRSRLHGWQSPSTGALVGRTALVTGPTSGLGRAVAGDLARLGARVVLVGRSEERLAGVRDMLVEAVGEDRFPLVVADMGTLESVRGAVSEVLASEPRLDVVVDNAGAIYAERQFSPDGIEQTLATLVVGPFVLIGGLLPLLRRSASARVISVASGGMYAQPLDLDDLALEQVPYDGTRAYARAKRAQVTLIREWARRTVGTGITFVAMHPGWVDTPGLEESLPRFYRLMKPQLRTIEQGADTITWLAAEPDLEGANGRFFLDRRPRPFDRVPQTRLSPGERARLWDEIVGLSGQPDPIDSEQVVESAR